MKNLFKIRNLAPVFLLIAFCFSCIKDKPVVHTNNTTTTVTTNVNVANKVLFIGNSLTYYNKGVDQAVLNMLKADDPTHVYKITSAAIGGYSLQNHYDNAQTIATLNSDKWDYVVLQDYDTETYDNLDLFNLYCRKFDTLIKKDGAKTAFFMTWARKGQQDTITRIASGYTNISKALGGTLVPVGNVWDYSLKVNPGIVLHIDDNLHPTEAGTYLTACVFYNVIWGKNPVGNTYVFGSLTADTQKILQQTAWNYLNSATKTN